MEGYCTGEKPLFLGARPCSDVPAAASALRSRLLRCARGRATALAVCRVEAQHARVRRTCSFPRWGCGRSMPYGRALHQREASLLRCKTVLRRMRKRGAWARYLRGGGLPRDCGGLRPRRGALRRRKLASFGAQPWQNMPASTAQPAAACPARTHALRQWPNCADRWLRSGVCCWGHYQPALGAGSWVWAWAQAWTQAQAQARARRRVRCPPLCCADERCVFVCVSNGWSVLDAWHSRRDDLAIAGRRNRLLASTTRKDSQQRCPSPSLLSFVFTHATVGPTPKRTRLRPYYMRGMVPFNDQSPPRATRRRRQCHVHRLIHRRRSVTVPCHWMCLLVAY